MTEPAGLAISKYQPEDENNLLTAIKQDPDWDIFTHDNTINLYRDALKNSITYVCYQELEFAGYIRAMLDNGIAIYVSELFVVPKWRKRTIGRSLLRQVQQDFPKLTVYALSDEDPYYEKLGYQKIGSVFQL